MRVLYIENPEADYQSALIYMGLCKELGHENVVDWPFKPSYHGQGHEFDLPSHYTHLRPGGRGYTAPFTWMPSTPPAHLDDIDHPPPGLFDLIVLAAPREWSVKALRRVQPFAPLVVVDGEDYATLPEEILKEFRPRVLFKREMTATTPDRYGETRIVPLPLSSPKIGPEIKTKAMDVVLLGGTNAPGGVAPYAEVVRHLPYSLVASVAYHDYMPTIARSRMTVALRGHGMDCMRTWEMASCPGTMLVAQRTDIVQPLPMVEGVHCAYFGDPGELDSVLKQYLQYEDHRAKVAAAGFAHILKHHTPRARARYLLREAFR